MSQEAQVPAGQFDFEDVVGLYQIAQRTIEWLSKGIKDKIDSIGAEVEAQGGGQVQSTIAEIEVVRLFQIAASGPVSIAERRFLQDFDKEFAAQQEARKAAQEPPKVLEGEIVEPQKPHLPE